MYTKIVLSSLVTAALLAINGCGGGGSAPDTGVASSSLSGVAVDDLILDGMVEAKDPSGNLLAAGRTSDSDGKYTINVNYTGVVLLKVTCDENSTMYNPETNNTMACGTDVSLNSLGSVLAGTDLTLNISPLTEIVYQRAEALADGNINNVDATNVEAARTEIGLMFGVDPLTDNPTVDTYADVIATIHTLADEDNETSVMDIVNSLAQELSDGEADGIADGTLSGLVQVMADENIANNLVDTNGTYMPPEESAALSDIDAAKALFTELRTQAMSVTNYNNSGFLDTEALSMEQALNGVVLNLGVMGEYLNYIANDISYMLDNNLQTLGDYLTQTSPGNWEYSVKDENGTEKWSGTVSIPAVLLGDAAEAQLYTSGTLIMTVDGTVPLDYEPVVQDGIVDSQSFNGTLTVAKRTGGADITLSGEVASNGASIQLTEANAELAYTEGIADEFGNTESVLNYFKLHNVIMQGVVGGYTIDGSVIVNSYTQNALLVSNSGWLPNDITFAGAISRTGASIEGTLNAKWLNAETIDMDSDVAVPLVAVVLNGKLQMPERPEMLMSLTFENDATHNTLGASYTYDTTVINAEGIFDTDMINGDVVITTHTGLRANIKVSNELIVYDGTSTVTKDGLLIGEFEEREDLPVIKYIDGSFESIF